MPGGRGEQERVAEQFRVVEGAEVGFEGEDRGVEGALVDLAHQTARVLFPPHDCEAGIGARQPWRDLGQQVGRDGRNDADAQRAREGVGQLASQFAEVAGGHEHGARLRNDGEPGCRYPHLAPVALEDAHAERALDLRHLRAERRLRHVTRLGGPPEAAEIGDGNEVLQLAQRHRRRREEVHSVRLSP